MQVELVKIDLYKCNN